MQNHNHLLGRVEGMDGIKTGYTAASGFNLLTSVRRGGHHIVAVVLGGASAGARDRYMASLIEDHIDDGAGVRTAAAITEDQPAERVAAIEPEPAPVAEREVETNAASSEDEAEQPPPPARANKPSPRPPPARRRRVRLSCPAARSRPRTRPLAIASRAAASAFASRRSTGRRRWLAARPSVTRASPRRRLPR